MRAAEITILGILVLSFVIGACLYPVMPEKIASHWNISGEVDGHMPKFWGLFLMPLLSVGFFLFFIIIPGIDPLKANIKKFRRYFDNFIVLIFVFLFYLYLLTIFWNLGLRFNLIKFLAPAFAMLFYHCGILVENAKRNWFVGIRTPWTLSSEKVWTNTHKVGGKLFKISGVIAFFAVFFPGYAMFLILVPIILVSVYLLVYSYLEYQKKTKIRSS